MKNEIQIDVEEVLNELGIQNVRQAGAETNYSCPGSDHKWGDHRPSAYMRGTYPYPYICFGCGRQGTVVDFVAEHLGISRERAWAWLGERYGFGSGYDPTGTITETLNRILGPQRTTVRDTVNPEIKPHGFLPLRDVGAGMAYLIDRGLEKYTIEHWILQFDPRSGRIAIPIYDNINRLVGFKARDIAGNEPKYLVLGDRKDRSDYGFKPYNSSQILYSFNRRIPDCPLIVVEGELNTIKCWQAGIANCVGLPTAALSAYQAALIRNEYEDVILFLDSDEAGLKGVNTALNLLVGACKVKVVEEHDGDPMDMSREQIKELIDTAKSPLTKLINERFNI